MFAIVEIAGKQYKVEKGSKIKTELLKNAVEEKVTFKTVMLTAEGDSVKIGDPYLVGPSIDCKILEHGKDAKVRVFKKKAKKRYTRNKGHRQKFTSLEVLSIKA